MSRTKWRIAMGLAGTLIAVGSGFQLARAYFEGPAYEVVSRDGAFEVRRYAPRVVAETFVARGDQREATSEGFRRLADYIFGGNQRIAMTTPVEATPAGERIAMTTPVESVPTAQGWRVAFTMPAEHRLEELPAPRDPRVTLARVEGATVAALRFSGRMTDASRAEHERALRARLDAAGLIATSEVTVAVYDPPFWVLPIFRRNEVLVAVRPR